MIERTVKITLPEIRKSMNFANENNYVDIAFIAIEINDNERPHCVILMKILAPECMLPK